MPWGKEKSPSLYLIACIALTNSAISSVWDELEEWTRGRIQEWMQLLLVDEVSEFLGRSKYQRRGEEMQGYRNGYGIAERKFRRINSPELLPAVAAGQQYHDGLPIKAGQHQEAAA